MGRKRPSSFRSRTFGRLERVVTALVEAELQEAAPGPPNLVQRLRCLERSVLASERDRQTLQVIASGRRLLGDPVELAPFPERPSLESGEGPRKAAGRSRPTGFR